MEKTTNYQLPKWEKSDFIKMDDFNDMTQKLDAALKAEADARAEKADGAAMQQALSGLQKSLGVTGKNCRIVCGSYVGTGVYGSNKNLASLNFDFYPAVIIIGSDHAQRQTVMVRGAKVAMSLTASLLNLTWTDSGVSWWSNGSAAADQNNATTATYYYVALGYDN